MTDLLVQNLPVARLVDVPGGHRPESCDQAEVVASIPLPADAVAALAHLHEGLRREGLTIRASAHVGVIEERGGGISGVAVHAAARIVAEAGAGQTVVSQPVTESAEPRHWRSIGVVGLKGIVHPIALFRAISATGTSPRP